MRISGVTYATRKTHGLRNFFILILILILLAALAAIVLSCYKSWELLHPGIKPLDTFSSNIIPEYRDISLRSTDKDILLKGWLFQAKNSNKAVILSHSYENNRLQFGIKTVDLIKEFLENGYSVFAFDLRNSGESTGKNTTFGYKEKEDIETVISYMNRQGYSRITLMGFSTGASAAILAAAGNNSVDAVIADSPYADLKKYFQKDLDEWTRLPDYPFNRSISFVMEIMGGIKTSEASPVNSLNSGNQPDLLLIHNRDDRLIPVENSIELNQKYSARNTGKTEFWMIEDEGHADGFEKHPKEYMEKVLAFLERVYEKK